MSKTLLHIEESYQELRYKLNTYSSNRIKLELLRQFLMRLIKDTKKEINLTSYYQELIPYLIDLITNRNLEYRPIAVLQSLQDIFEYFINEKLLETKSSEFENAISKLAINIAVTHFYLGEWYKGFKVFNPKLTNYKFQKYYNKILDNLANPSLITIAENLTNSTPGVLPSKNSENLLAIIENHIEEWKNKILQPRYGAVWSLLVEQESGEYSQNGNTNVKPIIIGSIHQLMGKAYRRANDTEEDLILFNNRSISMNDLLYLQANDAISAAKDLFHKRHHKYYRITYSFPDKNPIYSGESLGLAMGLVNVSSISQMSLTKYQYQLRQNFTTTGSIDISGNAKAIAEQSLKSKLEALVYSPFNAVLVANNNHKEAERIFVDLTKDHPNRSIDVISVKNLKETTDNSKIISKEVISLRKRWLRSKIIWFIIPLLLLLLIPFFYDSKITNDDCSGAIKLISNTDCKYTTGTVEGATYDPTLSYGSCDKYLIRSVGAGVFYKFKAVRTTHTISVEQEVVGTTIYGGLFDAVLIVYSGSSCSDLTEIGCHDEDAIGSASVTLTDLTIGKTYWIRIYDFGAAPPLPQNSRFKICVMHTE